jgi:hypothetical protein
MPEQADLNSFILEQQEGDEYEAAKAGIVPFRSRLLLSFPIPVVSTSKHYL